MTISGFAIYILFALLIVAMFAFIGGTIGEEPGAIKGLVAGVVISIIVLIGLIWYYNNTADGARQLKSQRSNFSGGIERIVTVYDVNGKMIQKYEGKFDVDYDDNRIIFDDENDKRHVIYYPTGTIIIDEK